MPNVTTCTSCGALYEAGSEETAIERGRLCRRCSGRLTIDEGVVVLASSAELAEKLPPLDPSIAPLPAEPELPAGTAEAERGRPC